MIVETFCKLNFRGPRLIQENYAPWKFGAIYSICYTFSHPKIVSVPLPSKVVRTLLTAYLIITTLSIYPSMLHDNLDAADKKHNIQTSVICHLISNAILVHSPQRSHQVLPRWRAHVCNAVLLLQPCIYHVIAKVVRALIIFEPPVGEAHLDAKLSNLSCAEIAKVVANCRKVVLSCSIHTVDTQWWLNLARYTNARWQQYIHASTYSVAHWELSLLEDSKHERRDPQWWSDLQWKFLPEEIHVPQYQNTFLVRSLKDSHSY